MVEKVTGSIFTRYEKSARSQQGMAIWRDEAFLYYHGGSCDVMDLKEKKIVGHFLPESYTERVQEILILIMQIRHFS